MRGSFANYAQNNSTQVTFYFEDGHSEAFNVPVVSATFGRELPELLAQPLLTFHLTDQTVVICTAKVIKIEIKPALNELQGGGIFPNCQRVTAMQRATTGRLPMSE